MRVVGIGGGSAAGKTTLARRVTARQPGAAVLSLDDYFRTDREPGPFTAPDAAGVRYFDLNHPDAVDWSRVHAALEDHRRCGTVLLIVEGTFALVSPDLRSRMTLRVFLAAPEGLRLERKAARNLAERGVPPEVTRRNHALSARPGFRQFVAGSAAHADLILNGEEDPDGNARILLERLR